MNFKWDSYNKIINFKEIWFLIWYDVDKFIYWNIVAMLNLISVMNNYKLILLVNWWVVVLWIVIYYKVSLLSVVLKKLRVFYIFCSV